MTSIYCLRSQLFFYSSGKLQESEEVEDQLELVDSVESNLAESSQEDENQSSTPSEQFFLSIEQHYFTT